MKAIIITATYKEKDFLIVYQQVEQTIATSSTQLIITRKPTLIVIKLTTEIMSTQILRQKTGCH